MKTLILTTLTSFCLFLPASQAQSVFRIDSLPANGVLLDKGWKFHAGDNPEWAKPAFDDAKWADIDPTKGIFDLPQLDRRTGRIGWLRLRLRLDSILTQQLVLQIRQSGASEVYLNGRLILRFGRIGKTPAETEAFTPNNSPVSFPASVGREQVLTVRYALQPGIRYGQHFGTNNPGLSIRLNRTEAATATYREWMLSHRGGPLYAGSFGILALLFLTFFLFFSIRREALYFAVFCLCLDKDPELIGELLDDLSQNLQKITHHGGRASSIVKGMLEHSRTSTGERQSTNLNTLADEYIRLAYQGMRAKDKDFNCALKTDFDPALPTVEVIPQEIGRVLLNLYNNAFYAVSERQKQPGPDYQPMVSVSTRLYRADPSNRPERVTSSAQSKGLGNMDVVESGMEYVEIRISDNGTGIPDAIKPRIFQPFFTTKPTGEGTGLGLSLSYDIVTKGHGGTIEVLSNEGSGSEFIIQLPR